MEVAILEVINIATMVAATHINQPACYSIIAILKLVIIHLVCNI